MLINMTEWLKIMAEVTELKWIKSFSYLVVINYFLIQKLYGLEQPTCISGTTCSCSHPCCGNRALNGRERRLTLTSSQLLCLEINYTKHWPVKGEKRRHKVCSENHKQAMSRHSCEACDGGLHILLFCMCWKVYHTKLTLIYVFKKNINKITIFSKHKDNDSRVCKYL